MKTLLIILCILIASPVMGGLEFDGTDDYVDCGNDSSLDFGTSNFAILFWVKLSDIEPSLAEAIEKQDASNYFQIFINHPTAGLSMAGGLISPGTARFTGVTTGITDTDWHHLVFQRNSISGVEIFLDGVNQNATQSLTDYDANCTSTANLSIGAGTGGFLNCKLYDVRAYNRDLSLAEIQTIYHSRGSDNIVNGLVGRWLMNEGKDGSSSNPYLIAHWKMNDNAATTAVDDAMNNAEGTLVGGDNTSDITFAGKINTSLELDGTNDYITATLPSGYTNWSLAVWVLIDVAGGVDDSFNMILGATDNSIYIAFNSDGTNLTPQYYGDGWNDATDSIIVGDWHHIVFAMNSVNGMAFYIDGVAKGTNSAVISMPSTELRLGSRGIALYNFNGKFDDYRIYNKTLTQTNVTALYNSDSGTENEINPKIIDISGNGNNGSSQNNPLYRATLIKLIRRPR